MMVRVPGSGKSLIANQLGNLLGVAVISPDECRVELLPTGNVADRSVNQDAWKMVYARAGEAIENHQSVIINGTHGTETSGDKTYSGTAHLAP